jgi:hypothetical protein
LTSTSPLARIVFDKLVFKPQGSSSVDPISPEDNSFLTPRHEYDTPNIRDDLWVNHGIGTFTIKEIGHTRNTVTYICHGFFVIQKFKEASYDYNTTSVKTIQLPAHIAYSNAAQND